MTTVFSVSIHLSIPYSPIVKDPTSLHSERLRRDRNSFHPTRTWPLISYDESPALAVAIQKTRSYPYPPGQAGACEAESEKISFTLYDSDQS